MQNALIKTTPATRAYLKHMYVRLHTFFGLEVTPAAVSLYIDVLERLQVTEEQMEFAERRAYEDIDLAQTLRYRMPLVPALLLNLLKDSTHESTATQRKFTWSQAVDHLTKYHSTKRLDQIFDNVTVDGNSFFVLKRAQNNGTT